MKTARGFALAMMVLGLLAGMAALRPAHAQLASTPDGTVMAIAKALGDGQPQVLWSALPSKYQADIQSLLAAYATKMDKDIYEKTFALLAKGGKVLREKKTFILGLPMLQQGPAAAKKDEIAKHWNSAVDVYDTIVQSEVKTLEGVKNLNVEKFLAGTGAKLVKQGQALAAALPADETTKGLQKLALAKEVKVSQLKTEGDTATMTIEVPGEKPKEMKFKQVEGKWLPEEMVSHWDEGIAQAKQTIAGLDLSQSKQQIMGMMGMAEAVLDQLMAAQTQEQFTMTVMQTAAMFGGGGPPGAAPPQ